VFFVGIVRDDDVVFTAHQREYGCGDGAHAGSEQDTILCAAHDGHSVLGDLFRGIAVTPVFKMRMAVPCIRLDMRRVLEGIGRRLHNGRGDGVRIAEAFLARMHGNRGKALAGCIANVDFCFLGVFHRNLGFTVAYQLKHITLVLIFGRYAPIQYTALSQSTQTMCLCCFVDSSLSPGGWRRFYASLFLGCRNGPIKPFPCIADIFDNASYIVIKTGSMLLAICSNFFHNRISYHDKDSISSSGVQIIGQS
jgi:hypothetical protein